MWTQAAAHLTGHPITHTGSYSWTSAVKTAITVLTGLTLLTGLYRAIVALLRRTILSHRDLAARLGQLACGTTTEYTDSILGPPAFRRALGKSYEEHIYRARHAWIQTVIRTAEKSVESFAITVTDPRFTFRTFYLTNTNLDIRLGRTRFSDIAHDPDGYRIWWGANRFLHAESHYFGNPGNYQTYVLANNDAGTGARRTTSTHPNAGNWESGRLRMGQDASPSWDQPPTWVQDAREGTAVNTLLICGDTGPAQPKALTLKIIGPDYGTVRVLPTPQLRKRLRQHRRFMRKINRQLMPSQAGNANPEPRADAHSGT